MGCYLAPGDGATIRDVETEMAEKLRGAVFIVVGDLNVDLGNAGRRGRYEDIMAAMATAVLEDLAGNFLLRRWTWCWDWRMWATRRQRRVVRSRTNCILGSDRPIFQNMAVRDPRYNSDHFMVVGSLHRASLREHYC